jgi:hypothetical protein
MYLLTLTQIRFRPRDDVQTVTYQRRIPDWLSQWTVANNYAPYLMADNYEPDRQVVRALVVNKFLTNMRSAVGELMIRSDVDHLDDFEFKYNLHRVAVGEESTYVCCGSFHGGQGLKEQLTGEPE